MLIIAFKASAQNEQIRQVSGLNSVPNRIYPDPVRIAADPEKGFLSPYYLFIPDSLTRIKKPCHAELLVIPNNTGKPSDDSSFFDQDARHTIDGWRQFAADMGVVVLIPVFPRPKTPVLYTHALSRAAMLTDSPVFHRLDLQLIAMIDDAIKREQVMGVDLDKQVFMYGFSAGGMFVNRFVFMHPDRVLAAAFGSPGGWAIVPVASWKGKTLPYPVGTADFRLIVGADFKAEAVAAVPQFLFMGSADKNDSVVYSDSYDEQNKQLIFDLFGGTLLDRWAFSEQFYHQYLPYVQLKLYEGEAHHVTTAMKNDIKTFFKLHQR